MGSGNSKDAASSSSSSTGVGVTRSRRAGVFHSSCFGKTHGSSGNAEQVSGSQFDEHGRLKNETCTDTTETNSDQVKHGICGKDNGIGTDLVPSISSNLDFDDRSQETASHTNFGAGSSSTQTIIAQSSNPSSRIRSRFSFLPGNFSFGLNRAASLGSSEAYSLFSPSLTIPNTEAGCGVHSGSHGSEINNNVRDEEIASHVAHCPNNSFGGLHLGHPRSGFSVHLQNEEIASSQDAATNNIHSRIGPSVNGSYGSNHTETENFETRRLYRRIRAQEPVEGSVQFSRTLSVGRLRDRVLRRTSNEGSFGHQLEDSVLGDIRQDHGRHEWGDSAAVSNGNPEMPQNSASYRSSSTSSSLNRRQEYDLDTPQLGGESSNHNVLEHRTAFLERGRRARSQVRALQRLGSRFENLAGHERSCILSGQHRTGRCLCRTSTSANSLDDDRSTRASISRIVLLAEALFEVLDEIHQQSVVLSSRPSVSSLGSVPAPKEVVECMPLRTYARSQQHHGEEALQCYICLVEYEEGDQMRVLPCHHEFHQTCVDKWLKEIHRVCPLCRGDVTDPICRL